MSSSTAVVKNPKENVWSGGNAPMKASYGKLMMWFFLLSDAFSFSALLISYLMVRFMHPQFTQPYSEFYFSDQHWPIPEKVYNAMPFFHGIEMPLIFVGIMTFILILSSVTMVLAVEAGNRMDQKEVEKWMIWTIIGGMTFLGCQAWEWSHFISGTDVATKLSDGTMFFGANLHANQYGPPLFADFFFFITGFHGMHVTSGVILNIVIFYNVVMGVYERRGHYEMVEKVGLYWHFVDLVWVFVFTLFYLI
ncbi:cytochrome c oxidase subunit 3 [Flexithrix dorotheae]|uniref:cytochrome c oxidase subunit 3 n=1 Tax=Flexithrix dorotheae TaxID=70993 RepID=UPI0003629DD9|nr:cytochrome c oxidase subunit 3 [Flexithrix dorotheae]